MEEREGRRCLFHTFVFKDVFFSPPTPSWLLRLQGMVCLDILKDKWTPALNIGGLLLSLASLLSSCNPSEHTVLRHMKHTVLRHMKHTVLRHVKHTVLRHMKHTVLRHMKHTVLRHMKHTVLRHMKHTVLRHMKHTVLRHMKHTVLRHKGT